VSSGRSEKAMETRRHRAFDKNVPRLINLADDIGKRRTCLPSSRTR
jgi:hypothetical protein